jgi:hypothetical protein
MQLKNSCIQHSKVAYEAFNPIKQVTKDDLSTSASGHSKEPSSKSFSNL